MPRAAATLFSHLALWPGLYIAAAVLCLTQLAGLAAPAPQILLFALLTASGAYLLDRVKLRSAWLDPADARAHPARFAFLAAHAPSIRALALALLVAAAAIGFTIHRWFAALPLLAALGVLLYAARPRTRRPRPKDILLLKNAYVSLGITGFALLLALAPLHASPLSTLASISHAALAFASLHLFARIFADAALCDLDDEHADRAHGTVTLPTTLGRSRAWTTAMLLRIAIASSLLLIPLGPPRARHAWAAITILTSLALRLASPARVRDLVDARFPAEALLAAAWLHFTN